MSLALQTTHQSKKKRGGRPKGTAKEWHFEGMSVCEPAVPILMGIGKQRWNKLKKGQPDRRRGERPKGELGEGLQQSKTAFFPLVSTFLWKLWNNSAEGLPEKMHLQHIESERGAGKQITWKINRASNVDDSDDDTRCPDLVFCSDSDSDDDDCKDRSMLSLVDEADQQDLIVHEALLAVIDADNAQSLLQQDWKDLPKRYLPPGQKVVYYWQLVKECTDQGERPPSWTTFKRIWSKHFKHILGFRKSSQHSKCSTCEGLKHELKAKHTLSDRLQVAGKLSDHLVSQWRDRQVYWRARHLAKLTLTSILRSAIMVLGLLSLSITTLMIDGMDQAKFRVPRQTRQPTKDAD